MEQRTCPVCKKQTEIKETENKNGFEFVAHYRLKERSYDESEESVHLRNIVDVPCEGSGKIFVEPNPSIFLMTEHRTFTD